MKKCFFCAVCLLVTGFSLFSCKNISTQNSPNTSGSAGKLIRIDSSFSLSDLQEGRAYELVDDFEIDSSLTLPKDVTLVFHGGSITVLPSGSVDLNGCFFSGNVKIKGSLNISGQCKNDEVNLSWFSDMETDPGKNHSQNAAIIEKAVSITKTVGSVIFNDIYPVDRTVSVSKITHLKGTAPQYVYGVMFENASCGIFTTELVSALEIEAGGALSLTNFSVIGWSELGSSQSNLFNYAQTVYFNMPENSYASPVKNFEYSVTETLGTNGADTCGIKCIGNDRGILTIKESTINGFVYGIYSDSSYIEDIQNSYLSCCRYGLCVKYSSDFSLYNVHFNTCHNGYNFKNATVNGSSQKYNVITNAVSMMECTCALYLEGVGMVKVDSCKFEFNALSAGIEYYGNGIIFSNCIFDSGTGAFMAFNSMGKIYNNDQPNISDVNVNGCTFMRGCQVGETGNTVPGNAYFVIRHNGGGATQTNPQKLNLSIAGNSFSDNCNLPGHHINNHQPNVFYFDADSIDDCINVSFYGNDLDDTAATTFAAGNGTGRVRIFGAGNIIPDTCSLPAAGSNIKYITDAD